MWIFIVLGISVIVFLLYKFIKRIYDNKYRDYILKYSRLIGKAKIVNSKYSFNDVKKYEFNHSYDNEIFYASVSPKDFLTYQLIYIKREVLENIKKVKENVSIYQEYQREYKSIEKYGIYDTDEVLKNEKKLLKMEKSIYEIYMKKPTLIFQVNVKITLTNIQGRYLTSKGEKIDEDEIKDIISRLNDKTNDRYNDRLIWEAITRVERAKVSNKMRFAVYQRDGYRCRKCGRKTNDLEVDHIFPIAKGGKTEFNNLQTLCHKCNALKSDTVEAGSVYYKDKYEKLCKKCGAPMKLKKGTYGEFYGCSNYPKCDYVEKIK